MSKQDVYDVTIIGGGPTGLYAAFYGGMRQLRVKIMESMPQLGGQIAALCPGKPIYAAPGYAKVSGDAFVEELMEQAYLFDPTVVLNQTLQTIEKTRDGLFILSTADDVHYSRTILITAGAGALQPRRLKMENAAQYEKQNLHYFIKDRNRFKGRNVFICGGGNSAVDWALILEPIAASVTLCHRRNQFRAHEQSVEKLMKSSVHVLTPFYLMAISGDKQQLQEVVIQEINEERKEIYETDDLIIQYGFDSSIRPTQDWGLHIEKNAIGVDAQMETNIEGIFAAGDITTYKNKVKLLATGFGEAPIAISNIKSYLHPESREQSKHHTKLLEVEKV